MGKGHRSGMIPQPNTSTGFIRSDDGLFEAMISNMSHDDFLEYIDLCSKNSMFNLKKQTYQNLMITRMKNTKQLWMNWMVHYLLAIQDLAM